MPMRLDRKEPAAGRAVARPWWILGLVVCLGYLGVEASLLDFDLGLPLDDGWIHLQFAHNLFLGNGLSYNPGELVVASTAPLWTALLSMLFWLPGSVVLWAKVLGVGLHLLSIAAVQRLGRELGLTAGLADLAAVLYLATSWMVWSALSAMEVPLFVLLSLWAVICHLRERRQSGRAGPLGRLAGGTQ